MPSDLRQFDSYDKARAGFEWNLPAAYNIAADLCERNAGRLAAIYVGEDGTERVMFERLDADSNRLASALSAMGFGKGSRVCAVTPSTVESLIITLGALKLGAVLCQPAWAAPREFYEHPLQIFEPDVMFYDPGAWDDLAPWLDARRTTRVAVYRGGGAGSISERTSDVEHDLHSLLANGSDAFRAEPTSSNDPAVVSFTSGSTGKPKAVMMAHRFALAVVPSIQMLTDLGPRLGDVFFASLGWNHLGGLRPALFPAWHLGCPVVATDRAQMSAEDYYALLAEHRVTVAHIMPSMLKKMREVESVGRRYDLSGLRAIYYTGEPLSPQIESWFRDELQVSVNPYYGSAELSMLTSGCARWFDGRPGSAGKPIPGRRITILDEQTLEPVIGLAHGIVAIDRDDPALPLGYWRNELNDRFFHGDYFLSGDVCQLDEDGYLWYLGRRGEVIRASDGTIVTPNVIEGPALTHAGVKDAAAIQLTDTATQTKYILLCIVPRQGVDQSVLTGEVLRAVESVLPATLLPLRVRAFDELPHTQGTNKLQRSKLLRMFSSHE